MANLLPSVFWDPLGHGCLDLSAAFLSKDAAAADSWSALSIASFSDSSPCTWAYMSGFDEVAIGLADERAIFRTA